MNQSSLTHIVNYFINKTPEYNFNQIDSIKINSKSNPNQNPNQSIPVLEMYQYEIINHPESSTLTNSLEYDSLSDNDSECSAYSYSNEPTIEFKKSSCDIIINGSKINLLDSFNYYYQYLQNLYKLARLKNNSVIRDSNLFEKIRFDHSLILNLISDYERIFNHFINLKKMKECDVFKSNQIDSTNIYSNNFVNHIKKINITDNQRIICIGDVHGSIHSFIRLLFRFHKYDIIDIKTMKIKEPYHIVFLGDVIDRGYWGVEITCTLLILLINNPDRMHWNSGNHEDKSTNKAYGFYDEIKTKYKNLSDNEVNELYDKINKFYGYLSCAIVIHNIESNKKYWLCHGGIPQKLQSASLKPVEPENPFNKFFYIFDSEKKSWRKSLENEQELSGYYLVEDETAHSIKWGDFPYEGNCSGRMSFNLQCNNYEYFMDFMNKYGFNGIIRGHQDSISNSLIYKKEKIGKLSLNSMLVFNDADDEAPINNVYWNGLKDPNRTSRFTGPLARVHMDLFNEQINSKNIVQPIVTLSTNTDKGRKLTADSFGLLRFDINSSNVNNFNEKTLESKNKINNLNNNQEQLFKSKYLKYDNLEGISLEQVFYKKYLKYNLDRNLNPSFDIYFRKYLKYKTKYLMLKNKNK